MNSIKTWFSFTPLVDETSFSEFSSNSSDELKITAEDFKDIVEKIWEKGEVSQTGVKQSTGIKQSKITKQTKKTFTKRFSKIEENKDRKGFVLTESFLAQASRAASSSTPIMRYDSTRKWHENDMHSIDDSIDDQSKSIMIDRCRTQLSEISAVLNNSTLSLYAEHDGNEELFEEMEPKTSSYLERNTSRRFLLTVRQESGREIQNKQLLVSIEDTIESDSDSVISEMSEEDVKYKDSNVSLRKLYSMRVPSKRFLNKNRTISIKEIQFCK